MSKKSTEHYNAPQFQVIGEVQPEDVLCTSPLSCGNENFEEELFTF